MALSLFFQTTDPATLCIRLHLALGQTATHQLRPARVLPQTSWETTLVNSKSLLGHCSLVGLTFVTCPSLPHTHLLCLATLSFIGRSTSPCSPHTPVVRSTFLLSSALVPAAGTAHPPAHPPVWPLLLPNKGECFLDIFTILLTQNYQGTILA